MKVQLKRDLMDQVTGGTDFLQLDPGAAGRRGLTDWLTARLRAAVVDGRLPPGTSLPPTRVLAGDLGVSRGVVVEAYRRLAEEGLAAGRSGAGTRVLAGAAPPATATPSAATAPAAAAATRPPDLDLSPGVPDLSAFPRTAWLRAERAVLAAATPGDLGYGDPRGNPALRRELAGWLARTRGVRARPDDILVVAGVAQALALLARVLTARGVTAAAVEDPGSRGTRDQLDRWGLRTLPVPVDADGMRVDELAATGAAVALLTPAHQFPTGVLLAPARRVRLLDWARRGGLVIEDDYDAEHRYDRAPTPALQASAPGHVAHAGSTSKALAPGLRLGWLVAPPGLHPELVDARHASDLGAPALPQLVLAHLIAGGELDRHLRRVRARQRARRDALLAALREHLPGARVRGIAAGLHLTVDLPRPDLPDAEVAAAAARAGVLVQPLGWHRVRPGPPGLVIGYAAHPPDRLRHAARLIGEALRGLGG